MPRIIARVRWSMESVGPFACYPRFNQSRHVKAGRRLGFLLMPDNPRSPQHTSVSFFSRLQRLICCSRFSASDLDTCRST